ncbi:MAG: hypothetical protein QOK16_1045 [Solirubrobacteraceae bacterium]|jgi:hypothetical protein|nr:hypothetical protein [Solirubrobacteraceae bacterium]MEA2186034.1 hypothetical protein [Solirubrobacteraceae bacterium]
MSTLVVIVVIGLWTVVVLVVIAACRAAKLGDEALMSERLDSGPVAIEEPVGDRTASRLPGLERGLVRHPRSRDGATACPPVGSERSTHL